ncbi:hypothetical protein JMJ35_003236 [Cladonia borealis]|uniref:Heterokaryon incompatibility domain-containing protein n=1 Tax=Cladonia borealis TaxID=184061 RepID=A0AA39V6N7_9LECA|nr:hypothetical protein JMJ35_003236 [Cladonia borealis]
MDENEYTLNQSVDQSDLNLAYTPYEYDVLPNDSIRILSLLPGNRGAPLQCELHRADVPGLISPGCASGPKFEALSYAWGDGTLCQRLFCNNSAIKITQSLFDALIHLRHSEETRMLWVDAVCIDQNNNDDKIVQLPHMKDIYQHANHVVIWLGLADESTNGALDLIRRAANCLRQESGQFMPRWDLSPFNEPFSDEKNRQWGFPSTTDLESWLPVAALLARSWFYRCWTFQEAVLATKATIQIGAHLLDWAVLCGACMFFMCKSYGMEVKGLHDGLKIICRLSWASRIGLDLQEWKPMPLIFLLLITTNTQATLPKDRIFGLLALAQENTQKYFSPSGSFDNPKYNMSLRELYTDVSRFLLHENVNGDLSPLRLLHSVKHYALEEGEQEKRNKDDGGLIPSWVKRWHDPIPEFKIDSNKKKVQPMAAIAITGFCTGGPEYHTPESNPQTPYEISLHGFIFAPISNTVNILRLPAMSRLRVSDLFLEIHGVREERYASYPTGESIDEVFALTLTMAKKPHMTLGAETYHAIDFQHFCVSLYEQDLARLIDEGRIDDIESLIIEWEAEYERLRSLVETHVMSPWFWVDLQMCCRGRKLFSTLSGHIGVGDGTLEPGDLVCVFLGGETPFIIRPVDQKYKFVGECYLHGIMHGEALEEGLKRRQLITLI